MTHGNRVTLSRADRSWVAYFYDVAGKRCGKSLGLIKGHSKNGNRGINQRQARVLRDRLAVELQLNPVRGGKAPKLGDYLARYLKSRSDLKPSTQKSHDMTCRYLNAHFTTERSIDRIDRASARDWRMALAHGDLESARKVGQFNDGDMSESTACRHVRQAKVIFSWAVADDLIPFNPFDRLKGKAPVPDADWKYVTTDEFSRILEVCPDVGWRVFLTLQRLGGLRRGEALDLPWTGIHWNEHRLAVIAEKTGKRRVVPVPPPLYDLLLEAFEVVEAGEEYVVPKSMISRSSVRKRFESILRRAGLPQWEDLFQVLRRNAETDLAQRFPQYVVSNWMGHDMKVSADHYLQVPEELYRKVAQSTADPSAETTNDPGGVKKEPKLQNNCKTAELVGDREEMQVLVTTEYPRQGSNLQPSAPEADALSN